MKRFPTLAATAVLGLGVAGLAMAGDNPAHPAGMMGEHTMPGTVTKVDHKTGLVDVTSLGMHLVVHFPPPTIKSLKPGEKIDLELGYKPTP